jgi:hypothetical protein
MNWEYYNDHYSIPAFEASWAAGHVPETRSVEDVIRIQLPGEFAVLGDSLGRVTKARQSLRVQPQSVAGLG